MQSQPATEKLTFKEGECDLESRDYMMLNAEIEMLKNRLIKLNQNVDCLTHPYIIKISQMLDIRLNEFERFKKSAFLSKTANLGGFFSLLLCKKDNFCCFFKEYL